MKKKFNHFLRPISIVQLFSNTNIYEKEERSLEKRKANLIWNDVIFSSIYLFNNQLFMNEKILKLPDFKNCDLIVIEDTKQGESKIYCVNTFQPFYFHIFKIELEENNLVLTFQNTNTDFAIPKRDIFKLCNFPPSQVIEIKYNAKKEMRSTSEMGKRLFKEQQFIFQNLGVFDTYIIDNPNTQMLGKQIPIVEKTFNLIKPLW